MAISFSKYIRITSGVIGANTVDDPSFCLRLFTDNPLIPQSTVGEFDDLTDVGTFFGTGSPEYLRAAPYFGFVSKQLQQPDRIQYGRWVDVAQAAMIFGTMAAKLLATFTAITAGGYTISIAGVPLVVTGLNLSAAGSLAAVAADLQTSIRTGTGTQFTNATVTYNASTNQFLFTSGATGAAAISVTDGAQTPMAALGWTGGGTEDVFPIFSPGAAIEAPDAAFNNSVSYNDNFGSFSYMPALTQSQALAIGTANYANDNTYLDLLGVSSSNATAWQGAMGATGGICATLSPLSTEYPELLPGTIFAATDYDRPNAAQNYEFQVASNLTPSVTNDTDAATYDGLDINYYGQTMKRGRVINFYQDGVMWGGITDVRDIGPYVNEIWLKSAMGVMLINLQLAVTQIPADDAGRRMLLSNSNPVIQSAKDNSVIQTGKGLTAEQQSAIFQATDDPLAWVQVQSIGYWLDWVIAPITVNGLQKYQAEYILVYSKADSVRVITGVQALV